MAYNGREKGVCNVREYMFCSITPFPTKTYVNIGKF